MWINSPSKCIVSTCLFDKNYGEQMNWNYIEYLWRVFKDLCIQWEQMGHMQEVGDSDADALTNYNICFLLIKM